MVIICDRYTDHVKNLWKTMQCINLNARIVVLKADGFLPDGICSPYEYFVSKHNQVVHARRELFYDFLEVPEYWEIRLIGPSCGAVYDMGCKKATIYFADPKEERNVQRVEWHTETEKVYKVDFYNKYGLRYASEFRDVDGNVDSRVFYSDKNQEIIVEQPKNDVVTLLENGMVKALFSSQMEFVEYYLEEQEKNGKYVLFIEDDKLLALADLKLDGKNIWNSVLFADQDLLSKYISQGGKRGFSFFPIPESYPLNNARGEVLILTASDHLEGIECLTDEFSDVMFHIAAHTLMSNKLHRLAEKENVKLYPQVSTQDLNRLWSTCDFYLDINYGWEIYDAVNTAHQKNLLIMGFDKTVHHRELLADECVFAQSDCDKMISAIKELVGQPERMQELMKKQQKKKDEFWKQW